MSTIGGLKANRTKHCTRLQARLREVQPITNHRANVRKMDKLPQLDQLYHLASDLLPHLQSSLDKIEETNQKMIATYEEKKDERLQEEFLAQLTTDDAFMQEVETAIITITNMKEEIRERRQHLERGEQRAEGDVQPQEVAGMQEMLQAMAQLTERFAAQQAPGAAAVVAPNAVQDQVQPGAVAGGNSVHLPKLEIQGYDGNILSWNTFWDSFEPAVHNRQGLTNAEKFNYLRSKLVGDAFTSISGLQCTNENYNIAIDLLKARFGQKQAILDAHYQAVTNLPHVSNLDCDSFLIKWNNISGP